MRRAQAILVIVALLAAPLALLARGIQRDASECNNMCCLPHGHHAQQHKLMECQHGELGHAFECSMKSGHHIAYGLSAPLVPAAPSAIVAIAIPDANGEIFAPFREFSAIGFLSAPYQPPKI